MSRRVSLNARRAIEDGNTAEIEVVLIVITHAALSAPIKITTDDTERLSVEPLAYGTRSTWRAAETNDEPFLFVAVSAILPGDQDDTPAAATLVLENLDNLLAAELRKTTERARVDLAVVLAGSPDLVDYEQLDLRLVGAEGDAGEIILSISRDPITDEPWPAGRMTRERFPGLHR